MASRRRYVIPLVTMVMLFTLFRSLASTDSLRFPSQSVYESLNTKIGSLRKFEFDIRHSLGVRDPGINEIIEEDDNDQVIDNTNKPVEANQPVITTAGPKKTFTVAYCHYRQEDRKYDPLGHSLFFAKWYGREMYPERTTIIKPCVALPRLLPQNVTASSPEGLRLLGLGEDVDFRICLFGATDMIKTLLEVPGVKLGKMPFTNVTQRMKEKNLWWTDFTPDPLEVKAVKGEWTHSGLVFWPSKSSIRIPVNATTGKPFGPYFARQSREPWFEFVIGASTQLDTKREHLSGESITVYFPFVVDSMSWRMTADENPNHWGDRLGHLRASTMKEAVTRKPDFNATHARLQKEFFMAAVNSHCAGTLAHLLSVSIREIFGFFVYKTTNRPVHFLGNCPWKYRERAGKHVNYGNRFHVMPSAQDKYRPHKFAITFENSGTLGYFTEKIIGAWIAETIPVYFGPLKSEVEAVLNTKAFVHCDLPYNKINEPFLKDLMLKTCGTLEYTDDCIHHKFEVELEKILAPDFKVCVDRVLELDSNDALYEQMLREPIATLDDKGELAGAWDPKLLGKVLRALRVGFGYSDD